MKRFWLLAAAVLLLWLDIDVATRLAYPEYIPNEDYGRVMQDMVMSKVVGTEMKVDAASDLAGYVLLFAVLGGGLFRDKRYKYSGIAAACGLITEVLAAVLPFWSNGATLYASEYFLRMGGYFLELAAIFFAVQGFIREYDTMVNHRVMVAGEILMMLSLLCGVGQYIGAFYQIAVVPTVYLVVRGFVNFGFLGCIYRGIAQDKRAAAE